ncbi:beta-L-arabinofuranosidase domain-containing protein [Arcticibacter tournemirensis]
MQLRNRRFWLRISVPVFVLISVNALQAQDKLYHNCFPLKDVTLLDGQFKHARDLNVRTLLRYDVDRLLAGYRKEAGLPAKAGIFPNWEGLDGHVAGHYLSALAMSNASAKNAECARRIAYIISELKACQEANTRHFPDWAAGYAGAVPGGAELWPRIKSGDVSVIWKYWVPWYNVHKMYAGLRDAWLYTGSEDAKKIFLSFCDWAVNITAALSDQKMEEMLGSEQGGMNEVLADAYQMTGDKKYLAAAKRFSHKMLLDAMAASNDNLDNKHANTQVPKAVGFQRIAEVSHDDRYGKAGSFFWETVTSSRTLAFGGNSRREFFPSAAACTEFIKDVEGPETCNTYNMMKLTEDLFRMNPAARYADFYEKALYNHILSSQHPAHGGYVYFTPARPRHYRVYSAPNQAMWCCVGSGMENHSKYAQFIYTKAKDSLYVNLFIPSELNWEEKKVSVRQETQIPATEQTRLTIMKGRTRFKMMIRYPEWVKEGELSIRVNGSRIPVEELPSSYICINRLWKKGDVVEVDLPMHNTVVPLINVPRYLAFMHGPVLLAAKTGTEDLNGLVAGDSRWGHIASGKKLPLDGAPILIEDNIASLAGKMRPVPGKPLKFTFANVRMENAADVVLEPFYQIHDSRYEMYWMTLSVRGYRSYIDSLSALEKQNQELEKRTIDFVAPGEQQPEADHAMERENSTSGTAMDAFWRDAKNNGYFSYSLNTNNEKSLRLLVRYGLMDAANRKFDIFIDDAKLATDDPIQKRDEGDFQNVQYAIPDSLVAGKKYIRIKFKANPDSSTRRVFYIRLLRR